MHAHNYNWQCQPKAENLVLSILNQALAANTFLKQLSHDLEKHTSTRLFDWLDHVAVTYSEAIEKDLADSGFVLEHTTSSYRIYSHPGAKLPRIVVKDAHHASKTIDIAVSVESIADFLNARGMYALIEGSPFSAYRRALVSTENAASLFVIERRGTLLIEPVFLDSGAQQLLRLAKEKWMTRPRDRMDEAIKIAEEMIAMVGVDMAAWIVLEVERHYWQNKNTAGQLQKNRQDRLGMGWANHDHHTFRSSRKEFSELVRLFEMLGFHCRERYYTGKEAGWGAQIMENSTCNLVLFLDVDLHPDEIEIDFAHHPLPEIETLGTIGLWTELHGDSILKGGMHHLEAQFLFEELTADLHHLGVGMMQPFSAFPFLKQAFTAGEIWHVDPKIVEKLYEKGRISAEQRDKFITYGAIGSHLENLQRREGYKGFNQKNVSIIIKKTDPRHIS